MSLTKLNRSLFKDIGKEFYSGGQSLTDFNKIHSLGIGATQDTFFTLPDGSSDLDGKTLFCQNESRYQLTVKPNYSAHIWNSGAGYGVELPDPGTMIGLRYCHAQTKWDIIYKVGGRVMIEGLKLLEPMNSLGLCTSPEVSGVYAAQYDKSIQHRFTTQKGVLLASEANKPNGCFAFDGVDGFGSFDDHPHWDIFGNQTGHKTVAFWVNANNPGVAEIFVSQRETSDNRWLIYKDTDGKISFYLRVNGVTQFSAGAPMGHNAWHHIALVLDDNRVGGYYDGQQIAYTETWNTGTFSGSLFVGQSGDNVSYLKGNMQDLMITYNNPFNANPNSALTDTFTVPNGLFQGVM